MSLRGNSAFTYNLHSERIEAEERWQVMVRSQRFKMFFAGLIFAIISFIGVNPIKTTFTIIKIMEVTSLVCLLFAGVFLLIRLNEVTYIVKPQACKVKRGLLKIIFNSQLSYWILFLAGMILLVTNRSIVLFFNHPVS